MQISDFNLTITPRLSKLGRMYRHKSTYKMYDKPSKWVNGAEKWHFIFTFVYTEDKTLFGFEFGYNDEFVRKLSHEDVRGVEEKYKKLA